MCAFVFLAIDAADTLLYVFIGIFVLTALLTLLSLPNWINIGEWYRKKLFLALIIEVVAIVLFIGKEMLEQKYTKTDDEVVGPITSAFPLKPEVRQQGQLSILQDDDEHLGNLPATSLRNLNLFTRVNSLPAASDKNDVIKWEAPAGSSKWAIKRGKMVTNPPFALEVKDVGTETVYTITNVITGEVKFNSLEPSEDVFNLEHRLTHFFGHENTYCMFRIISSELSKGKDRHVYFLQMKIEPALVSDDVKVPHDTAARK